MLFHRDRGQKCLENRVHKLILLDGHRHMTLANYQRRYGEDLILLRFLRSLQDVDLYYGDLITKGKIHHFEQFLDPHARAARGGRKIEDRGVPIRQAIPSRHYISLVPHRNPWGSRKYNHELAGRFALAFTIDFLGEDVIFSNLFNQSGK